MSAADRMRLRQKLRSVGVLATNSEVRDVMGEDRLLQHEKPKTAPTPQYGPTPDFVGPMQSSMLADLDRKLTPAEQADVTRSQSGDADRQLEVERAKGGPQSKTVSVTEKGAIIQAGPVDHSGMPWWGWLLIAGGGVLAVGGTALVVKGRRK